MTRGTRRVLCDHCGKRVRAFGLSVCRGCSSVSYNEQLQRQWVEKARQQSPFARVVAARAAETEW